MKQLLCVHDAATAQRQTSFSLCANGAAPPGSAVSGNKSAAAAAAELARLAPGIIAPPILVTIENTQVSVVAVTARVLLERCAIYRGLWHQQTEHMA